MLHGRAYNSHTAIAVCLRVLLIFSSLLVVACGGGGSSTANSNGSSGTGTSAANGSGSGTSSTANGSSGSGSSETASYAVGGSISGLSGSVVLQDNGSDNLTVSANGAFTFATAVASGGTYDVSVLTQPAGQTCGISPGSGSGTVANAKITTVAVTCTTNAPSTFTIGVTVAGLNGSGLVLQDNGADSLSVSTNGSFTFPTSLTTGQSYAVTVLTQPSSSPSQYCTVANASGTVGSVNISNVAVTCRNQGQYLYVSTTYGGGGSTDPGPGLVTFFGINSDGTLILNHWSYTFGFNPLGLALDTSGQYLYVTYDFSQSNIDGYVSTENIITSGGSGGQFSDSGQPADNGAGTSTCAVAVDPTAPYVFAGGTSSGSGTGTGTLYAYSTSSGVLTQLTSSSSGSSPYPVGGDPCGLAVDPTGKFLYVLNSDGGQVWGYSINNSSGALSALNGSPFTFQGGASTNTPYAIAINPNGGYLYITDSTGNTVTVYSYDSGSGALKEVGNPYPVGNVPESVAVDPTGQFLYVANSGDGTVSGFTINASTGTLTPMSNSPFPTGGGSSTTPTAVAVEPSGQYVYVANGDAATITVFSIAPTSGVLMTIQSAVPCPNTATCTVAGAGGTGGASALAIE